MGAGQSFKKDQRVDVYAQVSKPFYRAGQQLQGNVYLNVKAQTQYNALYIRIKGQSSGQHQINYLGQKLTYLDQFIIQKYEDGIVYPGNYTFPFAFVIPLFMSGSFYAGSGNYIRYTLRACLNSFDKKNQMQFCDVQINIGQLPKVSQGIVQNRRKSLGKCCGCCIDYGSTTVQIRCNKSIVNVGDMIEVEASIDNSKGSKVVQDIILTLQKRHIMTSNQGNQNFDLSHSYVLNSFANRKVNPGAIQTFNSKPIIPSTIQVGTSVGAITAIWFQLTISSSLGCCNNDSPSSCVRLFVFSQNFRSVEAPKFKPPQNWNPVVSSITFYQGIKPFIYHPCTRIMLHNIHSPIGILGDQNVINLNPINLNNMDIQNNQKNKPSFSKGQDMKQDEPCQSSQQFLKQSK